MMACARSTTWTILRVLDINENQADVQATMGRRARVTRGQLSKIVSNAAGFSDNQAVQMFQDVPVGSTFFQHIGRLASRGYINGYVCGGVGERCGPGDLPYFRPCGIRISAISANEVCNAEGAWKLSK